MLELGNEGIAWSTATSSALRVNQLVAGSTRRDIEKRSGKPVVTSENIKGLAGKGKKKAT